MILHAEGIVGKFEQSRSTRDVGNEFRVPRCIVARLRKQFSETGSATRRCISNRRHKIIPQEERFITVTAKRYHRLTDDQVSK